MNPRFNRILQKMTPGTMGGQSRPATAPGFSAQPSGRRPAAVEVPCLTCPTLVGRTQTANGGGVMVLPDLSELVMWTDDQTDFLRYAWPVDGSAPIETFAPGGNNSGAAITPDGDLWRVNMTGNIIRRGDHTSGASDTAISTLSEDTAKLVYSNHDGNLYAVAYDVSVNLKIYRITLAGSVSLLLSTSIPTGTTGASQSVSPQVVAAGSSIWINNPTVVGFSITDMNLYRYDIDANTISGSVASYVNQDGALAVDHLGNAIFHLFDPTRLYQVNESETPELIDCPELVVNENTLLQGGVQVPGNPTTTVMSHYIDYTGEPDADWIWQWSCEAPTSPPCPQYPTTYDTVAGDYVNSAAVALPSGSDGDTLVFIYYGDAAMSSFSGWTLGPSQTLSSIGGHGRYRVWYKTRAGGETTATLPVISGSAGYAYTITNIVGGGFTPHPTAQPQVDTQDGDPPLWTFAASSPTVCPRFAIGFLHAGDSVSFSGTFVEDSQAATSSVIDGHNDVVYAYVSDIESGSHTMSADAANVYGWSQGGWATWVAVTFSA